MYIQLERSVMSTTSITNFHSRVLPWGNGLGLRITKTLAAAAGVQANSELNITVEQGRIVIDVKPQKPPKPQLADMLLKFDPKRHSGELMAFTPLGKEVL
jgi:antitoxin component of MazEF toxin-antitoxin module